MGKNYSNLLSGASPKWGYDSGGAASRGVLGSTHLLNQPFSPWQNDILGQIQAGIGDISPQYQQQIGDLSGQIMGADPFGGRGGDINNALSELSNYQSKFSNVDPTGGYGGAIENAFSPLQDYQNQFLNQNPYYGNYEGQAQSQLGSLSGIANRLESGGGGLTPEEQQNIFNKAYTRASTPIEAGLARGGWNSLGGQNVLGNIASNISSDLAINEAQNRRGDIQNAANIRSGLAGQLFGQGQYGAEFGSQNLGQAANIGQNVLGQRIGQGQFGANLQSQNLGQGANIAQNVLGAQSGLGQYAGTFGRQGLNSGLDAVMSQAGLGFAGQQNNLSQLGNLYSMVRSGQLAPLDYLTALAGKQGIQRSQPSYPSSAKLADYLNSASAVKNLFGG